METKVEVKVEMVVKTLGIDDDWKILCEEAAKLGMRAQDVQLFKNHFRPELITFDDLSKHLKVYCINCRSFRCDEVTTIFKTAFQFDENGQRQPVGTH